MIITNSTPDTYYYEQLIAFLMSIKINSPKHMELIKVFLANYPDEKLLKLRESFSEVEFENNADEDMKVEYEIHLYDLSEDESVEDVDADVDVDEGDDEKVEFSLEIPDDVEDGNFAVLVIARADEDEDYCNYAYVEIDIEREKHKVVIEDVRISPSSVSPGEKMDVNVEVENIGKSDEDVYIELKNTELGISIVGDEFELEEYGDDDKETKHFTIEIPEDAEEKGYVLEVIAYYDDGDEKDEEEVSFTVSEDSDGGSSGGNTWTGGTSTGDLIILGGTTGTPISLTPGQSISATKTSGNVGLYEIKTVSEDQIGDIRVEFKTEEERLARSYSEVCDKDNYSLRCLLTRYQFLTTILWALVGGIILVLIALAVVASRR